MRVEFGPEGGDRRCMLGLSAGYLFTSELKSSPFWYNLQRIYIGLLGEKNNFYLLNEIFYCLCYRLHLIRKKYNILHFLRRVLKNLYLIFIWPKEFTGVKHGGGGSLVLGVCFSFII